MLLKGILEADEPYIVGKSRLDYDRLEGEQRKRGRGTTKDAVLEVVQRGGKAIAQLTLDITEQTMLESIKKVVKTPDAELITDQYSGYNAIGKEMKHKTLNRSEKSESHVINS